MKYSMCCLTIHLTSQLSSCWEGAGSLFGWCFSELNYQKLFPKRTCDFSFGRLHLNTVYKVYIEIYTDGSVNIKSERTGVEFFNQTTGEKLTCNILLQEPGETVWYASHRSLVTGTTTLEHILELRKCSKETFLPSVKTTQIIMHYLSSNNRLSMSIYSGQPFKSDRITSLSFPSNFFLIALLYFNQGKK